MNLFRDSVNSKGFFLKTFILSIIFLFSITAIAFPQNRDTILNQRYQRTLELISRLTDNSSLWSGQAGTDCIRRMNRALNSSTNLSTTNHAMVYRAAQSLIQDKTEEQFIELSGGKNVGVTFTGTYVDAMQLLELGIFPDLLIAILNEVKNVDPSDTYAARLQGMLNLTNTEAASMASIIRNHRDLLDNTPAEIARREREVARKEREAAEATTKREQEVARREREAAEAAARNVDSSQENTFDSNDTEKEDLYKGKIFVGLSYSYPLTFGISGGYMFSNRIGMYIDLGFTPADFGNYERVSGGYTGNDEKEIIINGQIYKNNYESTNGFLNIIGGLSVLIIRPLFVTAGAGISVPIINYNLFTQQSNYYNYKPVWIEGGEVKDDVGFIIEGGLLVALRFIYFSGKYRYINNSSTFSIGMGIMFS
jgi:hypothetical protein